VAVLVADRGGGAGRGGGAVAGVLAVVADLTLGTGARWSRT
jgi:hypothetical protein